MKRLFNILFPVILCMTAYANLFALNLYVSDPRNSFTRYRGTIENMTVEVRPQGTFIEAGIYLTFSPLGSIYSSASDTLEAILEFELPEKAFINGMWLFMSDTTYVEAKLMDKWSAGFIYEGIVQRRKDPSILYKKSASGNYVIKVFPMYGNSTRTVKINCLLPGTWTDNEVFTKLPINFIDVSYKKPIKVRVHAYPDSLFTDPVFRDNYAVQFYDHCNKRYGRSKLAEINTDTSKASEISFMHDFPEGVFVSLSRSGNEGFYQFVIDPKKSTISKKPLRLAIMFDYDKIKSDIKPNDIYQNIKTTLYKYLTPDDSFNIFVSGPGIFQLSQRWLPSDSINIEGAISILTSDNKTDGKTHLPELLYQGVQWVDLNADNAIVIIIADSDSHGFIDTANKVGTNTMALVHNHIQFNVCSFVQKSWVTNWISGMAVTGNDYLYWNLVKLTKGSFNKISENGNNFSSLMNNAFNAIIGGYENLNLITTLQDGYLYDKKYPDGKFDIMQNKRIIEYGKFQGAPPLRIDINGYYRKVHFNNSWKFSPDSNQKSYNDRQIWGATRLRELESGSSQEYMKIYDIINTSIDFNILSTWSAFLAVDTDSLKDIEKDEDCIPVELVFFSGYARENSIDLYWATASEKDNAGFYLEKRVDANGANWESLGFINGFGTTQEMQHYSFNDKNVFANTTYQYRLRQIDRDGSQSLGKTIVTVKYDQSFNLTMEQNTPNPFKDGTTIHFTLGEETFVNLEISDIYGNKIVSLFNQTLAPNQYEVLWNGKLANGDAAPNGIYLCKLSAGSHTKTIKMLLNR